jgi:Flp pilus assembly protein TadB
MLTYGHRSKQHTVPLPTARSFLRRKQGSRKRKAFKSATTGDLGAPVFALVAALITAVIVGSNAPNVSVAVIVFVLTGAILLFRLRRSRPKSAMHPRTHLRLGGLERSDDRAGTNNTDNDNFLAPIFAH